MSVETMKQALDALINLQPIMANGLLTNAQLKFIDPHIYIASEKLRQAIEQAEEQPKEARYYPNEGHAHVVWVGLTDEEILEIDESIDSSKYTLYAYTRAIEAKLKEKNHAS